MLRDCPPQDLRKLLRYPGVPIHIGPFAFRIRSASPYLYESIRHLYADFALADRDDFADFHVSLERPRGLRKWLRPKVHFSLDGQVPFYPMALSASTPLFEWGLNWVVGNYAHQYLVMHAAVLERQGGALLLPGPPGSGKSTLCAALAYRGWRLLSDELALVSTRSCDVTPIPRPISLKDESIDVIRRFAPDVKFGPRPALTHKGLIAHIRPPGDAVVRAGEKAAAKWVVFVSFSPEAPMEIRAVPKSRAFLRLADQAHNYDFLGAAGFESVARITDSCQCYDFIYADLEAAVAALTTLGS
jgi:HprK-related kinase A